MTKAIWAVFLVGCGGALSNPIPDGGPGNDAGTQDAPTSSDAGSPVCPSSPPTANAACASNGAECEYGTSPDPGCNQQFRCMNGGWVDASSGQFCPSPSQCPATWSDVPQNQECTIDQLACGYPEGTCFCSRGGGPPSPTDRWFCFPTQTGCASPRPDIGTSCSQPGLSCNYGSCTGGVELQCMNGVWTQEDTPCPL